MEDRGSVSNLLTEQDNGSGPTVGGVLALLALLRLALLAYLPSGR